MHKVVVPWAQWWYRVYKWYVKETVLEWIQNLIPGVSFVINEPAVIECSIIFIDKPMCFSTCKIILNISKSSVTVLMIDRKK